MKSHIETFADSEAVRALHIRSLSKDVVHAHITIQLEDLHVKNRMLIAFYADMLERGSKRYTKDEYEEALETLGADVSIEGGATLTIHIVAKANTIQQVMQILEEMFVAPTFSATEIRKLQKEYMQLLHEVRNNTRHLVNALFSRTLYTTDAPEYVPEVPIRLKMLKTITKQSLAATHASIRRRQWILTVAGDAKTFALVRETVKKIQEQPVSTERVAMLLVPVPAAHVLEKVPGKQNVEVSIGNHIPLLPTDADYSALAFGIDVLGKRGGFTGRLMSTVRDKEGLTYSIYAWLSGARADHSGCFVISTFFTPTDIAKGLSSTFREIRKIVKAGITEKDFLTFKTLLTNQYILNFESTESIINLYHSTVVRGLPPEFVEGHADRITALTRKKINEALKAYIDPERLVVAGAGTLEKIPPIA